MIRDLLTRSADEAVPGSSTGLLTTDSVAVLATPLAVLGAVAGGVGAATAVGSLATAAVALKGDEEEPAPPPEDAFGEGGHISALLARRSGALR